MTFYCSRPRVQFPYKKQDLDWTELTTGTQFLKSPYDPQKLRRSLRKDALACVSKMWLTTTFLGLKTQFTVQ